MNPKRAKRKKRRTAIRAAAKSKHLQLTSGNVEVTCAEAGEDGSKPTPRFSMTAYSGQPMRPGGWYGEAPLILDVNGMSQRSSQLPIHRDHDPGQIIGHSDNVSVTKSSVQIDGVVSGVNAHADEVVATSKNGFQFQASVGANLDKTPDFVGEGEKVRVNGRSVSGPVFVAREWTLAEASFVSVGADPGTSAVAARKTEMNEFEKWLEARGLNVDELSDEQITALQADFDKLTAAPAASEPAPEPAGDDEPATIQASATNAIADAIERSGQIQDLFAGRHQSICAQAIRENWSLEKAELELMKAQQAALTAERERRGTGPAIHSQSDEELMNSDVMAAAIHSNMRPALRGSNQLAKLYGEQAAERSERIPVTAGLHYLCYQTIEAAGGHVDARAGFTKDIFSQAVAANRRIVNSADITAGSAFSTMSLSTTLSNIANKMLLDFYNMWPTLVTRICSTAMHNDFKEVTKIRPDGDVDLQLLPSTGEIDHGTVSEQVFTNKVYTWARMLSVSRQDFINDDLGAFSRIGEMLGRGAMKAREKAMWITIMNTALNSTFWSTDGSTNGGVINHITGNTGGTIDNATLEAADLLLKKMEDTYGDPIIIMPDALISGTTHGEEARVLLSMTTVAVADTNAAEGTPSSQLRVEDQWRGRYQPIETPWIDTRASIPGSNDDIWFLLGEKDFPAFEYATLRSASTPTLESSATDFNTLGFQSRAYWDFGFKEQDPRGMIKVSPT